MMMMMVMMMVVVVVVMIPCGLKLIGILKELFECLTQNTALCYLSVVSWLSTMQGTDSVTFIMPVFTWRNWKREA